MPIDEIAYQGRQLDLQRSRMRRMALEHADHQVRIVANLPAEAPAWALFRTTSSRDLFMGNGNGRPLSRFTTTE